MLVIDSDEKLTCFEIRIQTHNKVRQDQRRTWELLRKTVENTPLTFRKVVLRMWPLKVS
jgi:hypothetical protein